MKYIFLIGSIIFGIVGISQAMDTLIGERAVYVTPPPAVFDLQFITLSFQATPGFVKILFLSMGLFSLFLIWQKLKKLGICKVWNYVPN